MAETTEIIVNGEKIQLETAESRQTYLIHQPGIRIDVPTFVEVNSRNTIDCMEKMQQHQWEWISTGQLFQELFYTAFPADDFDGKKPEIPTQIADLLKQDYSFIHVAGMITLGCEAMFMGKSVFFRTPEDHLHPKTERRIAEMFRKMYELAGAAEVDVATDLPQHPAE